MKVSRLYSFLAILGFGMGLIYGLFPQDRGSRSIACVDGSLPSAFLPLESPFFQGVQDAAHRETQADFYDFLSRVELQALQGRAAAQAVYGLGPSVGIGANLYAPPAIAPAFDPTSVAGFHQSSWGKLSDLYSPRPIAVGSALTMPVARPTGSSPAANPAPAVPSFIAGPAPAPWMQAF